ncbi:MAG: tRNA pseudouridine(55) synthase TruB [Angelakisella sp.]|nr:tRNA pseudouridine(55) synthase TruB [Angelakisella sp.]
MAEGIICIDKPQGFTSFDAVAKVRGITKHRKIGHGGTLDPMATGVLPLFFGRAAKATELMPVQEKRYTATFSLGLTTDTQDITGKVLSQQQTNVTKTQLEAVLDTQRGAIKQLPPMFSAVWVDGRRLYSLARQGIEIERELRDVTIHSLELLEFDEAAQQCIIDVRCSKGTYIRTLCHDIGDKLGVGATLTALRRTETLGFSIEECYTFEQLCDIMARGDLEKTLMPVDAAFREYGRMYLSPQQARMFLNGVRLDLSRVRYPKGAELVRVYEPGRFLGLARPDEEAGDLVIVKLFGINEEAKG